MHVQQYMHSAILAHSLVQPIINHSKSDPPHNTFLYNMSQDDTSFGLEPPDENVTDHILTEEPGTSDTDGWFCKDLGYHNLSFLTDLCADAITGFDATDGSFSDVRFKTIKATLVVLLHHLIDGKL